MYLFVYFFYLYMFFSYIYFFCFFKTIYIYVCVCVIALPDALARPMPSQFFSWSLLANVVKKGMHTTTSTCTTLPEQDDKNHGFL